MGDDRRTVVGSVDVAAGGEANSPGSAWLLAGGGAGPCSSSTAICCGTACQRVTYGRWLMAACLVDLFPLHEFGAGDKVAFEPDLDFAHPIGVEPDGVDGEHENTVVEFDNLTVFCAGEQAVRRNVGPDGSSALE